MKKKFIILLSILFIMLLLTIGLIKYIYDFNKDILEQKNKIAEINTTSNNLKDNINSYNQVRENLTKELSICYQETFKNNYSNILLTIKKYDDVITKISNNINIINKDCTNNILNDSSVNNVCNIYKIQYEQIVNTYVMDINVFNKLIDTYNDLSNDSLEKYISNYSKDYLDYNKDGKYEGVE